MYKKRSTYDMKERSYYTTHMFYDSVQLTASEDSLRRVQFSYFIDSVPYTKYDVRKNKNGRVTRVKVTRNDVNREAYKRRKDLIADYDFLPGMNGIHRMRKNYDLRSIKMEDQYIPPVDTTQSVEQGYFVAGDFADADSLSTDSLSIAPNFIEERPTEVYRFGYNFKNNKFNEDQDYYNKEFGYLLILKVPPQSEIEETGLKVMSESDTTATAKKKGFMSKFLSKKAAKNVGEDTELVEEEPEDGN
ncbi:MAG: hypothetical protein O2887_16195 [Bacteroidetes bacterium]|nr:hypothetical protein [Bacteroidota bacterium]MDA1122004.1 hypothetical protein [Bacteroidota bacterium]